MTIEFTMNEQELIGLLGRQRDAYRRLRALADRQRSLVLLDDATALLAVLADRQRVVEELSALNRGLSPYRERWTHVYRELDVVRQREAKELLGESNALLATVMASDAQDAETLGARRQSTATALAETRVAGRALTAYGSGRQSPISAERLAPSAQCPVPSGASVAAEWQA